jgi:phosphate transport system substrate-binding protein
MLFFAIRQYNPKQNLNLNIFISMKKFFFIIASFFILQTNTSFAFDFFKAQKRPYIYVVGSSTISPFMSSISEEFARVENSKNIQTATPVVESTGTHKGFKLFCGGVGYKYPDFVSASSLIRSNEILDCAENGVKEIGKIKIGYDGIVIGNAISSQKIKLTEEQIFLALAEKIIDKKSGKLIKNPYTKWHQIDSSLPEKQIVFFGPPLTSGTRDVFAELVMEKICMDEQNFVKNFPNHDERKAQCIKIRNDGVFITSGENDNFIITNLQKNPDALGIFGFNFLVANKKIIQAVAIDNILPTSETIGSKRYELSRPLFVYFKKEHLNLIPEMRDFIKEIVSSETIGHKGYLCHNGLIALSDAELKKVQEDVLY